MEKTNIAELLRDCPRDMELDCVMYEDVYFDYVDELNVIHCYIKNEGFKTSITFNQHGTPHSDAKSKCVIFPKGKTTWKGFVPSCKFKDGDIVATMTGSWIGITTGGNTHSFIPTYCVIKYNGEFEAYFDIKKEWCFSRLATEKERQRLFDVLKECGYRWHAETKTLEKLPKFKVGDKIRHKNDKTIINTISYIHSNGYVLCDGYILLFKEQDEWELVIEPIFKVGNKIKYKNDKRVAVITGIKNNCYFIQYFDTNKNDYQNERISIKDQDKYELVFDKFDITNLKPFDWVLVRDHNNECWMTGVYSHQDINTFIVTGQRWKQCIPYKNNEYLCGKRSDCNDFYKTWE